MSGFRPFGESHGQKRQAEDDLEANNGISTQLKKLRINHAPPRIYISPPENQYPPAPPVEYMPVDETSDRIVIHDLEAEIAQIEAEEPTTIFLPDIDKKVSAIPQRLLQNQNRNTNTQMVLYRVPESISVPKEQDAVRKAIIASRVRAREEQARERENQVALATSTERRERSSGSAPEHLLTNAEFDPDAMDIG